MSDPRIGPLLGAGKVAEVFAWGEDVLKLYLAPSGCNDAFMEAATLAIAGGRGLPVPAIREAGSYDGRWGLVMGRAPGDTLGAMAMADPALIPAALDEMVALHRRVHACVETRLRPLKARIASKIAGAPQLQPALAKSLLTRLSTLPDGDRLCHGDFHPHNIMGPPGATMIVDWVDATTGDPAADVCRSYVLLSAADPDLAETYVGLYGRAAGLPRDEILAWLPVIAAARLSENVPEEESRLIEMAQSG